jgi:3-hydroxyisobutyrate dehydrogenase-like beta-hydroxyacid dehydrogenase
MSDVTVVGTGVMGRAVVRACADAGLSVAVWNRTADRTQRLTGQRVRGCLDLRDAVRSSPVVVLCLLNYDISRQVLEPVGRLLAGRLVVQTASGVPSHVGPFQKWVDDAGGRYLEAAILNYPQAVGTQHCFTVYAGPTEHYEEIAALRAALAGTALHLGEDAAYAKAYHTASAGFYYAIANGFLECAAIASSLGVPLADFAKSIPLYQPGFQDTIDVGAALIDRGNYEYEQAPLTTHVDILRNLAIVAEQAGVDESFFRALRDRVQHALDSGCRREHIAVVFEQFRTAAAERAAAPWGSGD